MDNYKTLFDTNKDFRDYVLRFSKEKNKPVEEVLKYLIVHEVGDFYEQNEGI